MLKPNILLTRVNTDMLLRLTTATIFFLPMTFITGYFGMNIEDFPAIRHNETYFWIIAIPVIFVTMVILMKDNIGRWFTKHVQRRGIKQSRKGRLAQEAALLKRSL